MNQEQQNTTQTDPKREAPVPLYRHSPGYAREHGELEQWRASHRANSACRDAIEAAVRENFDGMYLKDGAAKVVLAAFGPERVTHVLAATIQEKSWDGRFSGINRRWAAAVPAPEHGRYTDYLVNSHPAVLDGFVSQARREMEALSRRHSIQAQLSAKPVPGDHPADKAKDREVR